MEEFIKSVTQRLGIEPKVATNATGSLLQFLKSQGDKGAVGELLKKLPGAEALLAKVGSTGQSAPAGGGGGILGKIGGMLGGLGGSGGGLSALASSGLSADKIKGFVEQFVTWAKSKVGDDLVNKVVGSIPGLKSIVG